MKNSIPLFVLTILSVTILEAREKAPGVVVRYGQLGIGFYPNPKQVDPASLPLVEGRLTSGSQERFGILLGGKNASEPVIEILNRQSKVVKTLSIIELTAGMYTEQTNARRAQGTFPLQLPEGRAQLKLKALATGDVDGVGQNQQRMILTFALKAERGVTAGLRVSLPVAGNMERSEHGLIISPKSGTAAIAVSVLPHQQALSVERNKLVVDSPPVLVEGSDDTALLWLVLTGVTGVGHADVRASAIQTLNENKIGSEEPRLVVVSVTDKETSQPADTVTYTVVCANVGTGTASNIVLSNPIPKGSIYLEQSVTTGGLQVSLERAKAPAPQVAEVRSIRWSSPQVLKPGGENIVSFKLIIQ